MQIIPRWLDLCVQDDILTNMLHACIMPSLCLNPPTRVSFRIWKAATLKDFLVIVWFWWYMSAYCYRPVSVAIPITMQFFNTTKWAACAAKKGVDNSKQILRGGFFTERCARQAHWLLHASFPFIPTIVITIGIMTLPHINTSVIRKPMIMVEQKT